MENGPTVSVLIPTYNRAGQVVRAVESVLTQPHRVLEVIVADDGSTDRTRQALETFLEQLGEQQPRVHYFYQENQGKSVALNNALARATGEWIAFLDSDDSWLREKLEWQFRILEQFGPACGACFTDARFINGPGLNTTAFQHAEKQYGNSIGLLPDPEELFFGTRRSGLWMQTAIVRAGVMRQVGEFDPLLRVTQDTDFHFRLSLVTKLCLVNKPLVLIDRTPNRQDGLIDQIKTDSLASLRAKQYMYEKWLRTDLPDSLRRKIMIRLGDVQRSWCSHFLLERNFGKARAAMRESWRMYPSFEGCIKWLLTWISPELARKLVVGKRARSARKR